MADPLSIAAAVAGLMTLAQEIYKHVSRYVKSVRDAEMTILHFRSEVVGLYNVLQSINSMDNLDEQGPNITEPLLQSLDVCQSSLDIVASRLLNGPDLSALNRFGAVKQRLTWPLKKKETLQYLNDLERCKSLLSLKLHSLSLSALRRLAADQKQIAPRVTREIADAMLRQGKTRPKLVFGEDEQGLFNRFSNLPAALQELFIANQKEQLRSFVEAEELKLLRFFSKVSDPNRLKLLDQEGNPESCDRVASISEFSAWRDGSGKVLLLSGHRETSKNIVAAHVFKYLCKGPGADEAVTRYACSVNMTSKNSTLDITIIIVMQLSEQSQSSMQKCRRFLHRRPSDDNVDATVEDLQDFIIEMSFDFNKFFVILDRLDELIGKIKLMSLKPVIHSIRMSRQP